MERSAKAVQLSEPQSPDSSCHPHGAREKLANVIWLSGRCLLLGPWATRHGEGGWSSRGPYGAPAEGQDSSLCCRIIRGSEPSQGGSP